jgi:3-isopropylmalate/(R)-2-methylmalate dehydratase large subunit
MTAATGSARCGSGQTIAEKVLSRQNVQGAPVWAGALVDAHIDRLMLINYPVFRKAYLSMGFNGPPRVWDRSRVVVMNDHVQPPADFESARNNYDSKQDAQRLNLPHFYESVMGVCHQIMVDDQYIRPGDLIIGNDSHTIAYGALNAPATGIGSDEAAYAFAFGTLHFAVPETIKVTLQGRARGYPFGKDVILWLAGQHGDDFAQDRAIEFVGPFASDSDMSTRLTIADHAVEVGGKFGVFLADSKTRRLAGDAAADQHEVLVPDDDAKYCRELVVNCDEIDFQVAQPYRFDNVCPVTQVGDVRIDQARIGSCANGRFEDIAVAAKMLRNRKVAPGVRFYVSPASMAVYRRCVDTGIASVLLEAGVQFMNPGCSICQSPGVVLNEEVCISSTTRNYRGRFGGSQCADARVYLAGPATVTAAAIAGQIVHPFEVSGDLDVSDDFRL